MVVRARRNLARVIARKAARAAIAGLRPEWGGDRQLVALLPAAARAKNGGGVVWEIGDG